MTLEVGNIVTITLADSLFNGKQAEIVEIADDGNEDGNIGVILGRDGEHLVGYCRTDEERIVHFKENELHLDDDWSPMNKAFKLFGPDMWHRVLSLKRPFDPERDCMHEGCYKKNTFRAMINIWGSVCEADLCDVHCEEWHGKCVESFPWKKQ